MGTWDILEGDCRAVLPSLADSSFDAVLTDPPYPEISRDYGRLTEAEWHDLMDVVVAECRRVLKPSGSAVFVLQPNSRHVGQMRLWLWDFLLRTAKAWNLVQDVYWWNYNTMPTGGVSRKQGLMRPSVKYCLWFGPADCYRSQDKILWQTARFDPKRLEDRALYYVPSGASMRDGRCFATAVERGGSTPFNLIPLANNNTGSSSGNLGHGAGTPYQLCEWWTRYIVPEGGKVLSPFAGASTEGLAAIRNGRSFVGIEKEPKYCDISRQRLSACSLPE